MAVSISRPDPTSPASVAEAKFSTARRGYDQDEVRELLRSVAAELGRLQEREVHLERELRIAQSRAVDGTDGLDDETVARVLGEETLHVLQTARESASQIKIRAEEGAARILREATEDANRTREQAEIEASRKRTDAAADAEGEVSLAKQQGREMVNEARAYRERVLSELTRRRELARQQIEQLILGRDRLLQVFERARLVAVDVVAELTPLGEPDEYVDLSPTTGPVPMMVPARSLTGAADRATADRRRRRRDADDADDVEPTPTRPTPTPRPTRRPTPRPTTRDRPERRGRGRVGSGRRSDAGETPDVDDRARRTTPVATHRRPTWSSCSPTRPTTEAHPDTGALFARLRAGTSDSAAGDADGEPRRRRCRRHRGDDLRPPRRRARAADRRRRPQAEAGARRRAERRARHVAQDGGGHRPDSHPSARQRSHRPLRRCDRRRAPRRRGRRCRHDRRRVAGRAAQVDRQVDHASTRCGPRSPPISSGRSATGSSRCVADGAGDNDDITKRVRAVYREWKTQHIDDQLDDVFRLAYGAGALAAATPGTRLCWMVDPHGPACPDAEDNALAGPVEAGDAYPTGHTLAPAHAGCRCLLAPVSN